ncbi:CAP domain-containing protein [Chitinophaga tropicalis]|uniref:CAP domain-containing protein n=1 Tax=Chitinophaga tropicalis TaxID=2683588 RepID=A0A7K1U2Y4_9BACT|nr:CAP domain-containing protein [Chitinophaga tropicalis]MVT08701.1 CAP domain-containing protein [Chitinophaga tropicalis]
MTRKLTLLVFSTFLTFHLFACHRSTVPSDSTSAAHTTSIRDEDGDGESQLVKDILYYTNQFRAKHGLAPLKLESYCCMLAAKHSKNMATGRTGFGHEDMEIRMDAASMKLGGVKAAAENVAYGTLDAKGVVDGWIKSPGHRKNMLGDYNLIGIGTADKGRITFFTQFFVKK